MRDFKFRAWDKTQNKMREVWLNKLIDRFGVSGVSVFDNEDFEVMQFTGYKDWKGEDIYEGDIISAPNGQIKKAVIYFSQATFWYKEWDEMYEEWHHSEMGWCEQYGSKEIGILHWSANRIALEVIGNIYEHSELMAGRHYG